MPREVRRATRRVTAEMMATLLKLPDDAQIIGADYVGRTNVVEIHYASRDALVAAEACVSCIDQSPRADLVEVCKCGRETKWDGQRWGCGNCD